jgi:IS30 family transposase
MLIKLHGFKPASAVSVLQAFSDKLLRLAEPMCQSMTYDQCREKAMRRELSRRTDIAVYFCYPHSPWQRGSNESPLKNPRNPHKHRAFGVIADSRNSQFDFQ